jgi:Cu-Zn family superoxide dismutase
MDRLVLFTSAIAAIAVAGCANTDRSLNPPAGAEAFNLAATNAQGQTLASATLTEVAQGVRVAITAVSLAPGSYGAHIHATGRCDAPDFTSAGGHWNPGGRQHGKENPQGMHKGDLPNLLVGADGRGSLEYVIAGATLDGAPAPILDADGAALVIHAAADDYRTDPSGNSGARIACGTIS